MELVGLIHLLPASWFNPYWKPGEVQNGPKMKPRHKNKTLFQYHNTHSKQTLASHYQARPVTVSQVLFLLGH